MALIPSLNTFVSLTTANPTPVNENFSDIRTAFNDSAVLTDVARTIISVHTFNPSSATAPFILGVNAQDQFVDGLNADQLDSQEGSFYQNADNLNVGTLADARVAESNVTQHQAALVLTTAQTTTGTFADARISESSVTQHQAALGITAAQVVSGTFDDGLLSANVALLNAAWTKTGASTSTVLYAHRVSGDTQDRLQVRADGQLNIGSGSAIPDVNLRRSAANTLRTDDAFSSLSISTGEITASGDISLTGGNLTFPAHGLVIGADPTTDPPNNWFVVEIDGVDYVVPAYTAV